MRPNPPGLVQDTGEHHPLSLPTTQPLNQKNRSNPTSWSSDQKGEKHCETDMDQTVDQRPSRVMNDFTVSRWLPLSSFCDPVKPYWQGVLLVCKYVSHHLDVSEIWKSIHLILWIDWMSINSRYQQPWLCMTTTRCVMGQPTSPASSRPILKTRGNYSSLMIIHR